MDHSQHLETYFEIVADVFKHLKAEGKLEETLKKFESTKDGNVPNDERRLC